MAIDRLPWSGRAFAPPPTSKDRDGISVPEAYCVAIGVIAAMLCIGAVILSQVNTNGRQTDHNTAAIAALQADLKALRAETAPWPVITSHARPEM